MKLSKWVDQQKRLGVSGSVVNLAASLGVNPLTVYRWMRGAIAITCYRAVQIYHITEGQVRPEDWPTPDHLASDASSDPCQLSLFHAGESVEPATSSC